MRGRSTPKRRTVLGTGRSRSVEYKKVGPLPQLYGSYKKSQGFICTGRSGSMESSPVTLTGMTEEEEKRLWKEIGARLRDARLGRKMTLEGVVEALDNSITFGALAHYERGVRPLPLPTAIQLARLLRIPAAELLGLTEEDMTNEELRLMASFRRLSVKDQKAYTDRIERLASLLDTPLPDERKPKPKKPKR